VSGAVVRPVVSDPAHPHPFVERFAAAWASRDPDKLAAILHPDVVLVQPLMLVHRGRDAAVRALGRFLELIPDLEIAIHDSVSRGDVLFIEFSFAGSIGRRRIALRLVDRIELSDGLVRSRLCYFDPRPLSRAVLLQPAMWPRLARMAWRRIFRNGKRNKSGTPPRNSSGAPR